MERDRGKNKGVSTPIFKKMRVIRNQTIGCQLGKTWGAISNKIILELMEEFGERVVVFKK
jgi:hypothetical protein